MLLKYGADITASSTVNVVSWSPMLQSPIHEQRNPLFMAIHNGPYLETILTLLRHGADLHTACRTCVKPDGDREPAQPPSTAGYATLSSLLDGVRACGSFRKYLNQPRGELVRLRLLCSRGRATPPPQSILERLFGAPAAPGHKSVRVTHRRLPNEVFWIILSYWRCTRDGRAEPRCPDFRLMDDVELERARRPGSRAVKRAACARINYARAKTMLEIGKRQLEYHTRCLETAKESGSVDQQDRAKESVELNKGMYDRAVLEEAEQALSVAREAATLADIEHTGRTVSPNSLTDVIFKCERDAL